MSNVEIVLEKVTVTHKEKTTVFNISYTDERPEPRAYIGDTSKYYDIPAFNAAIAKADFVKRERVADLFEHPFSGVVGRGL